MFVSKVSGTNRTPDALVDDPSGAAPVAGPARAPRPSLLLRLQQKLVGSARSAELRAGAAASAAAASAEAEAARVADAARADAIAALDEIQQRFVRGKDPADWNLTNHRLIEQFKDILKAGRADWGRAWVDFCFPGRPYRDFQSCLAPRPDASGSFHSKFITRDEPPVVRLNEALQRLGVFSKGGPARIKELPGTIGRIQLRLSRFVDSPFSAGVKPGDGLVLMEGPNHDSRRGRLQSQKCLWHLQQALRQILDGHDCRGHYVLFTLGLPLEHIKAVSEELDGRLRMASDRESARAVEILWADIESLHSQWNDGKPLESKSPPAESGGRGQPIPAAPVAFAAATKAEISDPRWACAHASLTRLSMLTGGGWGHNETIPRAIKWKQAIEAGAEREAAEMFAERRFKGRPFAKLMRPGDFIEADRAQARVEIDKLERSFVELGICDAGDRLHASGLAQRAVESKSQRVDEFEPAAREAIDIQRGPLPVWEEDGPLGIGVRDPLAGDGRVGGGGGLALPDADEWWDAKHAPSPRQVAAKARDELEPPELYERMLREVRGRRAAAVDRLHKVQAEHAGNLAQLLFAQGHITYDRGCQLLGHIRLAELHELPAYEDSELGHVLMRAEGRRPVQIRGDASEDSRQFAADLNLLLANLGVIPFAHAAPADSAGAKPAADGGRMKVPGGPDPD